MTDLVRGQNQPWPHPVATVLVTGAEVGALLLGADGSAVDPGAWVDATRPSRDGVEVVAVPADGIRIDLGGVPAAVQRVVVVASAFVAAPTTRVLAADDVEQVRFDPGPPGVETALMVVELYRRGGAWKVRAVGQGYAGGLGELARVHSLDPPTPPATAAATPSTGTTDPVERLGMILDDASRSTAAYGSSAAWASRRLHADLEVVVGDPAMRGPGGDAARAAARRRHDDVSGEALTRHLADLEQLRDELTDLEQVLPASLAGWSAPGWSGSQEAPWALRVGELGLESDPTFRIPMVRVLPMQPPLWVESDLGGDRDARRILAALSQRAVLALPSPPLVTVIDLGPGAAQAWGAVDVVPVTGAAQATHALQEHVAHLSVVSLAAETGDWQGLPPEHRPGRLLVVCDVPTGLDEPGVRALHTLVGQGAGLGVSVLMSGTTAPGLDLPVLADLHEQSLRIPSTTGGDLVDRYAGTTWIFHPDLGPDDPVLADRVRSAVAARRHS